jgi:hypothetical protein
MADSITLNYKQAINIINRMNDFEKQKIADYINDLTLPQWFSDFRSRMKNIPVSIDEITQMVEEVRKERYESSH